MAEDKFTLVYLENKPIALMELKYYLKQGVVHLSKCGQEITVSEKEKSFILNQYKNGTKPIFKEKGA